MNLNDGYPEGFTESMSGPPRANVRSILVSDNSTEKYGHFVYVMPDGMTVHVRENPNADFHAKASFVFTCTPAQENIQDSFKIHVLKFDGDLRHLAHTSTEAYISNSGGVERLQKAYDEFFEGE